MCDFASNDIKGTKPDKLEESILRSQEAYDKFSADIASELSERLECMCILTAFSKLLINPALPLSHQDLVKMFYQDSAEN